MATEASRPTYLNAAPVLRPLPPLVSQEVVFLDLIGTQDNSHCNSDKILFSIKLTKIKGSVGKDAGNASSVSTRRGNWGAACFGKVFP